MRLAMKYDITTHSLRYKYSFSRLNTATTTIEFDPSYLIYCAYIFFGVMINTL
jgi:hypothetical protein